MSNKIDLGQNPRRGTHGSLAAAFFLSTVLAGCSTLSGLAGPTPEELASTDDQACHSDYGLKRGSDAYADCRLRLKEMRAANGRALAANPPPGVQFQPLPPPRRPLNCTSNAFGNTVNTMCY